ncbi:MAG: hypothetical protein ACE5HK_03050 [Candidatus Methylomirabilales bacterium]
MPQRGTLIAGLLALAVLDALIPIPFAALLLLYVLFTKPPWFRDLVNHVYGTS